MLNYCIIISAIVVLLLTVVFWPVAALIRWHYGRKLELIPAQRRLRLAVRLVCLIDLVFVIAWVVVVSLSSGVTVLSDRLDPILVVIQILGVVGAVGTLLVLLSALRSVSEQGKWVWAKLHDVILALACVGFVWFIWHWNLINFNLNY